MRLRRGETVPAPVSPQTREFAAGLEKVIICTVLATLLDFMAR
jgi:hypothetical protein